MAPGCPRRRGVRRYRHGPTMNWREVEQELVAIAKTNGYWIEQDSTGDSLVDTSNETRMNLTEIAKELVDRLGRKG